MPGAGRMVKFRFAVTGPRGTGEAVMAIFGGFVYYGWA